MSSIETIRPVRLCFLGPSQQSSRPSVALNELKVQEIVVSLSQVYCGFSPQCSAFEISMSHRNLQFTSLIAFCHVLHRASSLVIFCARIARISDDSAYDYLFMVWNHPVCKSTRKRPTHITKWFILTNCLTIANVSTNFLNSVSIMSHTGTIPYLEAFSFTFPNVYIQHSLVMLLAATEIW